MKKINIITILLLVCYMFSYGQEVTIETIYGIPPASYRTPIYVIDEANGDVVIQNVPSYNWSYGCSATAAAMLVGYYDWAYYVDMYTGPTSPGYDLCPPTNQYSWWAQDHCPLSATEQGWDNLSTKGHVDDYWIAYNNCDADPYIQNNWTEHDWADCVGDFMGTNQSYWSNCDGSTSFFFNNNGASLHDYTGHENANPPRKDGCHGLREFCESRGYTVINNYNQRIEGFNGNSTGFNFSDYKNEINDDRPVLIQVDGHTMIGIGYNNNGQKIILYDTWDWDTHYMVWGGSYPHSSGPLAHRGVTVLELDEPPNGIYDYVEITEGHENVYPNSYYDYAGQFFDNEGNNTLPVSWEWEFILEHDDGEYIVNSDFYYGQSVYSCLNGAFPATLPNYNWLRNINGDIIGKVKVELWDDEGYPHVDEMLVNVHFGPTRPVLMAAKKVNNSLFLSYYSPGANNYDIFYDIDSGHPYSGTGAQQGNSPIVSNGLTTFQIDGLTDCTPYYFAIKGINDNGVSAYSGEKLINLVSPSNSLPVHYYFGDQIVHYDATYSDNYYIDGNLIIETGATVIFQGGIHYFEENSKIIIEPGGQLILDGATCTAPCGQTWQGIEVWGDVTEHQFEYAGNPLAQGKLVMKNNASIQNAWNAVGTWKYEDWNTMGGIVIASNSSFINNKRSVEFMPYQNYHPISGAPMNYFSYFVNCEFIVDDDYAIPSFYSHITMCDVNGIGITGCKFANNMSNAQHTGQGIYTFNAGYRIKPYCNASVQPCPDENLIPTTFSNLYAGIVALNSESSNTIYVYEAEFVNNGIGIQLNSVDNATIIFNDFYIGSNTRAKNYCTDEYGIGIDLINCNGYAIEENKFYPAQGMASDAIGVNVYYNPDELEDPIIMYNEIYNNIFDGVHIANNTQGNSFNTIDQIGLVHLCNDNSNNVYDFYITGKAIQQMQGSLDEAAGNEFSLNANNPYSDYNNQSDWSILYFYNENNTDEIPVSYSDKLFPYVSTNANQCLSHYGGGDIRQNKGLGLSNSQLQYFTDIYNTNNVDYLGSKALYESLKDGGDTPGTITDVEDAWPDEMWETRNELLAKSPHLSREVLVETADRTDLFPDAVIFEIFSANPDALKDKTLLEYLETKEDPLPQYMIDILAEAPGIISCKTILESDLAEYGGKRSRAANIIIRNILNDSIPNTDSLVTWLGNNGSMATDYQLIDVYLQQGDTTASLALIDALPTGYGFETDNAEYLRFKTLKQLQVQLLAENRNIYMLTAAEKTILEDMVSNSNGRSGMQARNILQFIYGNQYDDCPNMPDPNTHKSSNISIYDLTANMLEITASPNPAKSWVSFNYSLPETSKTSIIEVNSVKGELVHTINLTDYNGQVIWDTRKTKPGVYVFTLKSSGMQKSGKLIITK